MKSFKASWSSQKLKAILAAIGDYTIKYRVAAIALKVPPAYSHTPAINQLLAEIESLAKSSQIPLHTFTLLMLKNGWSTIDQKMNKKQLMEAILARYNLTHLHKKEMKNKNRHHERVFEAVGVADITLRTSNI